MLYCISTFKKYQGIWKQGESLSMESRNVSQPLGPQPGMGGEGESISPPELLSINELARCCSEETNKFLKQRISNDRFCMEIFRRGIVRRDDDAWACIYQQYAPLVLTWVTQHQKVEPLWDKMVVLHSLMPHLPSSLRHSHPPKWETLTHWRLS